jgi:signal transduction histidine kinase
MNLSDTEGKSVSYSAVSSIATTSLSGFWLIIARAVWLVLVVPSLGLFVVGLPVVYQQLQRACVDPVTCSLGGAQTAKGLQDLSAHGLSVSEYAALFTIFFAIIAAIWCTVGFLIFWRRSDDWLALFAAFFLVISGITLSNSSLYALALASPALALPLNLVYFLGSASLFVFLLLFPNGRLVPRWMGLILLLGIIFAFFDNLPSRGAPFDANWPAWLYLLENLVLYGAIVFSQIYRYRRVSTRVQRQQTKWVVFGGTVTLGVFIGLLVISFVVTSFVPSLNNTLFFTEVWAIFHIVALLIPLSIGFSILRYRLYDIDILINRTLVYALLTASTLGLYVLVVFGASAFLRSQNDLFFSLLATALIAVLFQPLRQWLQHGVNRLMFGERNEPYRVLSRLGQRLEETLPSDTVLPTIVETVAHALKLPYVAIVWKREQTPLGAEPQLLAAAFGTSEGSAADTRVPLVHQGKYLGDLVLSPRQRGEELTPADLRLVRDLAPQIGMALHSALLLADLQQLTADLQRSRERLVTAREEERRRLRRDLHDGLGPQLSSQTFTLSAIKKLLRQDPDTAERLLTDATTHAQEAIADIRRLVYALRPPALDDLGLLAALEEQIHQYNASGIVLTLNAPDTLPPLPAAIEMACYRIVQEALTNVVRHAHATAATVQLCVQEALVVEVRDNGQGLPPGVRSGVGLSSMRERAEELGGTCLVEARASGGTRVCARLPLLVGQYEEHETVQKGEAVR